MFSLLRASHPGPVAAVTAMTVALAVSVGWGPGAFILGAAVVAGQLGVGWTNDYLDRERDARAGRADKPLVAGTVAPGVVAAAGVGALVVCVPLSLASGWRSGGLHLAAVGAATAYNLGLKATVASPLPYLAAFALLPAVVTLGLDEHPLPPWWAIVGAGLLGAGAHFVNVLADIDDDLAAGVRGLPQRLGAERALAAGTGLLAAAVVVLSVAPAGPLDVAAVPLSGLAVALLVGVVASARARQPRRAWVCAMAVAGTATALLLASGASLA